MNEHPPRRRGPGLGEIIGLLALIISGLGVWISWQSANREAGPTKVVEERQAIPLTLRANVDDDGRTLVIAPVESTHALESLTVTLPGKPPISVGSDGRLSAQDVQNALADQKDSKGMQSARATLDTRYVEAGRDRRRTAAYLLRYRWEGGGLFSGRSLRLTGLSRS